MDTVSSIFPSHRSVTWKDGVLPVINLSGNGEKHVDVDAEQ